MAATPRPGNSADTGHTVTHWSMRTLVISWGSFCCLLFEDEDALFGTSRATLAALFHEHDVWIGFFGVDKGAEPGHADGVVDRGLPLALVGRDMTRHVGVEFVADA